MDEAKASPNESVIEFIDGPCKIFIHFDYVDKEKEQEIIDNVSRICIRHYRNENT